MKSFILSAATFVIIFTGTCFMAVAVRTLQTPTPPPKGPPVVRKAPPEDAAPSAVAQAEPVRFFFSPGMGEK